MELIVGDVYRVVNHGATDHVFLTSVINDELVILEDIMASFHGKRFIEASINELAPIDTELAINYNMAAASYMKKTSNSLNVHIDADRMIAKLEEMKSRSKVR